MRAFAHPRHVLSDLGIAPRKRASQNFICQRSLATRIAALPPWPQHVEIVEIGGGTGVLTDALAERFRDVLAIEIDRKLSEHLRRRYAAAGAANVALRTKRTERDVSRPAHDAPPRHTPDAHVVTVLEGDARTVELALVRRPPIGVFGNLPYALTTDLFMWLVRQRRLLLGAVIMVQREYADRLAARPRTKAYSSISVYAATYVEVKASFAVGPGVFYPRPKVGSTVLFLGFHEPPCGVDPRWLERVVRAGFVHRRKLVRKNLSQELDLSSEQVVDALTRVSAGEKARAEELSPEQFVELARALAAR